MKTPRHVNLCSEDLAAALRWIHVDMSPRDVELLVEEAVLRSSVHGGQLGIAQLPMLSWHERECIAGSYFKVLSGNVATLGGVRAVPGWEQAAVNILTGQIDGLNRLGLSQVQAIVRAQDRATAELVQRAGMQLLTEIEHLWLDVCAFASLASDASRAAASMRAAAVRERVSTVEWRAVGAMNHDVLARFIDETFAGTLDCPALNGRRTPAEVLDGFLDGRQLSDVNLHWELLAVDQAPVGCLLMQAYESDLMELVYMGLVPTARGRGLGKAMVARAIANAQRRACSNLVVAVDRDNWPARNVYLDWGFQPHQRLQVWLASR